MNTVQKVCLIIGSIIAVVLLIAPGAGWDVFTVGPTGMPDYLTLGIFLLADIIATTVAMVVLKTRRPRFVDGSRIEEVPTRRAA